MSELTKIFVTSGLTVFAGIVVFVLGQIVQRVLIEPIHEQRRVIARIAHALACYPTSMHQRHAERHRPIIQPDPRELRKLAADLIVTLPLCHSTNYEVLAQAGLFISVERGKKVALSLFGWRTATEFAPGHPNHESGAFELANKSANEIRKLLEIDNWMDAFSIDELLKNGAGFQFTKISESKSVYGGQ